MATKLLLNVPHLLLLLIHSIWRLPLASSSTFSAMCGPVCVCVIPLVCVVTACMHNRLLCHSPALLAAHAQALVIEEREQQQAAVQRWVKDTAAV